MENTKEKTRNKVLTNEQIAENEYWDGLRGNNEEYETYIYGGFLDTEYRFW